MAGWDDDEEGLEGLLMTGNVSSAVEAMGCWASQGWCILMPPYSGPTRGLNLAPMRNSG